MLSGEILNGPSLSVALLSYVPVETLEFYIIMAAIVSYTKQQENNIDEDDDDENILLGKMNKCSILP